MNLTKEEMLELAKKCDFALIQAENLDGSVEVKTIVGTPEKLIAYTSAIEEKYQAEISDLRSELGGLHATFDGYAHQHNAQIAMLKDGLQKYGRHKYSCDALTKESGLVGNKCDCGLEAILSVTQQSSDAFIAEVKAGAKLEGKIEALEEFGNRAGFGSSTLLNMIAELRNQQEGKE